MNRITTLLVITLLLIITGYSVGLAQTKQPISFEGILRLPDFGMDSKQIADQIAESGLTFEVTKAHMDSLQRLGFSSQVISAVRQFYRMGTLKIATIPGQVDIIVDNEPQGMSDNGGIWEMEVARGVHNIKVQKRGYGAIDSTVTVSKNKTLNLNFSLQGTAKSATGSKFFGRYGASIGYGISISPPAIEDSGNWKSGNNFILTLKANLMPNVFVDLDINGANFGEFDPDEEGDDFGSLNTFNFLAVPGVYKEFNENVRGYFGLGLGLYSSKIENGKFEGDGITYVLDEKGSKSSMGLIAKLGAEALVQENIFVFGEYRGYSVLGKYAMSFIVLGAGIYVK